MPSRMAVTIVSMETRSTRRAQPSQAAPALYGRFLPDPDALFGRQVHLVARLDVEGLVPFIEVPDHAEDPVHARRVRPGLQLAAQRRLAELGAPDLGPGHEEALITGKAVDHRGFLAAERQLVSAVGQAQAADIADVFTQGKPAVDAGLAIVERAKLAVLININPVNKIFFINIP